jgi:hypothetical protein
MMTRKAFKKGDVTTLSFARSARRIPTTHTVGVSEHCTVMVACSYITQWHTVTKLEPAIVTITL